MKLCVINCSNPLNIGLESDDYVDYRGGFNTFFDGDKMVKKCISWHSIAAVFESEFFVYKKPGWEGVFNYDEVLVLCKDHPLVVEPLVKKLKLMGKRVGVGFHENADYFSQCCQNLNYLEQFKCLCKSVDYYWNLNHDLFGFFNSLLKKPIFAGLHGVPFEWKHSFTVPKNQRSGVLIATRTFSQFLKRNTLYAVGNAVRLDERVTLLQEDNIGDVEGKLNALFNTNKIDVIKGPLSYDGWLRLIAKHKFGYQCDESNTYGQTVADGLLVGVAVYGGNSLLSKYLQLDGDISGVVDDEVDENMLVECAKTQLSFDVVRKNYQQWLEDYFC